MAKQYTADQVARIEANAIELYECLERMVRQNAQAYIGHDAVVAARRAVSKARGTSGRRVDWLREAEEWSAKAGE